MDGVVMRLPSLPGDLRSVSSVFGDLSDLVCGLVVSSFFLRDLVLGFVLVSTTLSSSFYTCVCVHTT